MFSSKLRMCIKNVRSLSTITSNTASQTTIATQHNKNLKEFKAVYPDLVQDLTESREYKDIPEVNNWIKKMLDYNVVRGKSIKALALVSSYELLEKPENLTPANIRLASIMGWCVEMLHAFILMLDDIIDGAQLRRGIPCWYKLEEVGLSAINDGVLLECSTFNILRKYFKDHPIYVPAVELFRDAILKITMGQVLDIHSRTEGRPNLEAFTMDRYNAIVKYKTAISLFQLPVALAMYLADKYEPELHCQAKTICMQLGHLYQVQDDFLDCFGKPELVGKDGVDIREGKCTWLVVKALECATPAQREVIQRCYGKADNECVQAIQDVYKELELPNAYHNYEEDSYSSIQKNIQQIVTGLPHKMFSNVLENIYRRDH